MAYEDLYDLMQIVKIMLETVKQSDRFYGERLKNILNREEFVTSLDEESLYRFKELQLFSGIIDEFEKISKSNLSEESRNLSGGLMKDLLEFYNKRSSRMRFLYEFQQKNGLTNAPTE